MLEDRFAIAGAKTGAIVALCLVFWVVSDSAEAMVLTWLFMVLHLICLAGAWIAFGWRVGFFQRHASRLAQLIRVRR